MHMLHFLSFIFILGYLGLPLVRFLYMHLGLDAYCSLGFFLFHLFSFHARRHTRYRNSRTPYI